MKTQMQKPSAGKTKYSKEYKQEALAHWKQSGRSAAPRSGGARDSSAVVLSTMSAIQARAADAVPTEPKTDESAVVKLSPFEVNAGNQGYMATNTMSGTRIASKLEDLAAS
jgi:hypothetical protein